MIKLIVFDYDGVIVDSFKSVHNVYQIICEKFGKECPFELKKFRKEYGKSHIEFMDKREFSDLEKENAAKLFSEEIIKQNHPFYEGVKEVILNLSKNYKLFIVSSNYADEIKKKLEMLGVLDCFDEIIGEIIGNKDISPKSVVIKKILENEGIKGDEAIMIGDREVDYLEAKKAGIENVILVEYGWGYNRTELREHKQEIIVNEPKDILTAVEKISNR
jgi:phosphoglycolate phosphatase